jgi:hypothetical protein
VTLNLLVDMEALAVVSPLFPLGRPYQIVGVATWCFFICCGGSGINAPTNGRDHWRPKLKRPLTSYIKGVGGRLLPSPHNQLSAFPSFLLFLVALLSGFAVLP